MCHCVLCLTRKMFILPFVFSDCAHSFHMSSFFRFFPLFFSLSPFQFASFQLFWYCRRSSLSLFLLFYLQSSHLVLELCYVQYYFILIITVCILWHRLGDIFSLLFLSIFALLFFVRLFFLYFCQFSVAIYYAAPHNS